MDKLKIIISAATVMSAVSVATVSPVSAVALRPHYQEQVMESVSWPSFDARATVHLNAGRIHRPLRSGRNARFTSLS